MPDVNESPTDPNDDMFSPAGRKLYERLKALVRQEIRARRVSLVEATGVAFAMQAWGEGMVREAMEAELDGGDGVDGGRGADWLSDLLRDPDSWKKGGGRE